MADDIDHEFVEFKAQLLLSFTPELQSKELAIIEPPDVRSFVQLRMAAIVGDTMVAYGLDEARAREKLRSVRSTTMEDTSMDVTKLFDLSTLPPGVLQEGKDLIRIMEPYLPALRRAGESIYEDFVKHMGNKDWESIDQMLYEKMTVEERRTLLDDVYKEARAAAIARYERVQMTKELAWKITTNLLIKLVVG